MTEAETALMKRFGITAEQKSVYAYKGYKYEHLKDALNYAKRISSEIRYLHHACVEVESG